MNTKRQTPADKLDNILIKFERQCREEAKKREARELERELSGLLRGRR